MDHIPIFWNNIHFVVHFGGPGTLEAEAVAHSKVAPQKPRSPSRKASAHPTETIRNLGQTLTLNRLLLSWEGRP